MTETPTTADGSELHRKRLFTGICLALFPTGAAFALISNVLTQLKTEFLLNNAEVGFIGGASVGGMAFSLLVIGPFLEVIGMKRAAWGAFIGHIVGLSLMLSASFLTDQPAQAVWLLTIGAVCLAIGNGMIEVVGNPLTATLYPDRKAQKLNIFHAFFPLSIVLGGLLGIGLSKTQGVADGFFYNWSFQLGIVYIPIIVYGIMVLPQKFPETENAEAGFPVKEMFRFTLTSPLMWAILVIMALAIGIELGVGRWLTPVFNAVGIEGALLLSWYSLVMMVLRFFSGKVIGRFSPVGVLAITALFVSAGLYLFSIAETEWMALIAATCFGIGVAYNFPTIVGLVAERLPRTGSLGIVLTAGVGLGAAGFIGQPGIGKLGDAELGGYIQSERAASVQAILDSVDGSYPDYIEKAKAVKDPIEEYGYLPKDLQEAHQQTAFALKLEEESGTLDSPQTAVALRAIASSVTTGADEAVTERATSLTSSENISAAEFYKFASQGPQESALLASQILGPAEGVAGQRALRLLTFLPLILTAFFGTMYFIDKRKGGYKAKRLDSSGVH